MTTSSLTTHQKIQRNIALIRSSFYAWAKHALAPLGEVPARHHEVLIDALTDVAEGRCKRLIVQMPPGSAKSTFCSVLFPIWLMATKPHHKVILASYAATLAESHSERARSLLQENAAVLGIDIPLGKKSVKRWAATNGSEYKCVGAGSAITGLRADIILIDDPFAGREEADSPTHRNKIWRWWQGSVLTRLRNEDSAVIIVMTRWHSDDLAGRLIADQPDKWRVLSIPALCEDPETDLLGRELHEPMWPEWHSAEFLDKQRRDIGEREFSSLYQQRPISLEGALFKTNKIEVIEYDPDVHKYAGVVRAWDIAATSLLHARNPDWTVGVKMARLKDGRYVILDVVKIQGEPAAVERLIIETAHKDGKSVSISIPQDPGASGKHFAQAITRELSDMMFIPVGK